MIFESEKKMRKEVVSERVDDYGVRGLPNTWFQSFLSGRSQ